MPEQETVAPAEVDALLTSMLEADGYTFRVHEWPANDEGRAAIEIIATADACADCLVPKDIMKAVLRQQLPPGIVLDDAGLMYPGDKTPSQQ